MMNSGNIIENSLNSKNMTKRDLYNLIVDTFFNGCSKNYTTYASMSTRIAEDKMNADEFLYATALLDIDISKIYGHLKSQVDKRKPRVATFITPILLANSRYCNKEMKVEVASTNLNTSYKNERYYLISMDEFNKKVYLELFDLDELTSDEKISLDFNNVLECSFEEFIHMSLDSKINYLTKAVKEKDLAFYGLSDESIPFTVVLPKIKWDFKFLTEDHIDEVLMHQISETLKRVIPKNYGYGVINKTEFIEMDGYKVFFKIIDEIAIQKDFLHIQMIIKIDEINKTTKMLSAK